MARDGPSRALTLQRGQSRALPRPLRSLNAQLPVSAAQGGGWGWAGGAVFSAVRAAGLPPARKRSERLAQRQFRESHFMHKR